MLLGIENKRLLCIRWSQNSGTLTHSVTGCAAAAMECYRCPVCLHSSFDSVLALWQGLMSGASRRLACPVCDEVLLGLDKLTLHLYGHLPSHPAADPALLDKPVAIAVQPPPPPRQVQQQQQHVFGVFHSNAQPFALGEWLMVQCAAGYCKQNAFGCWADLLKCLADRQTLIATI